MVTNNAHSVVRCSKKRLVFLLIATGSLVVFYSLLILFQSLKFDNRVSISNVNCSSLSWGNHRSVSSNCTAVSYTGSVCRDHLLTWQQCTVGHTDTVWVSDGAGKSLNPTDFFSKLPSEDCYAAAIPILCRYLFPLCDSSRNKTSTEFILSYEECVKATDNICKDECVEIDCSQLLSEDAAGPSHSQQTAGANSTMAEVCSEDFSFINGSCRPICPNWEQLPTPLSQSLRTIRTISITVGLLCAISSILLAVLQHERMLKFPAIALVYYNIGYGIVAAVGLIGEGSLSFFYCSSTSLTDSINNPSMFCTFSGAILHYFLINLPLWSNSHIYTWFHKIMWPSHRPVLKDNQRFLHLIAFVSVVLFPVPLVLIAVLSQDHKYTIFHYPPMFCFPSNPLAYYTLTLFVDILTAASAILLVVIFWMVHKLTNSSLHHVQHQGIFKAKKNGQLLLTSNEKKLAIIFCYQTLLNTLRLMFSLTSSQFLWEEFDSSLESYFTCEASCRDHKECSFESAASYSLSLFFTVYILLVSVVPLMCAIYLVNTSSVKQRIIQFYHRSFINIENSYLELQVQVHCINSTGVSDTPT